MSRSALNLVFQERTVAGISKNHDGDRVVSASVRPDGTVRKELKIRPGFTPQEDVALYRSRGAVEADQQRATRGAVPGLRPGAGGGMSAQAQAALSGTSRAGKKKAGREEKRQEEGANGGGKAVGSAGGKGREEPLNSWDQDDDDEGEPAATPGAASPPPVPSSSAASSSYASSLRPSEPSANPPLSEPPEAPFDTPLSSADQEKRVRALKKKLRQAEQLRDRSSSSSSSSTGPDLSPSEREKVDRIGELEAELARLAV
ncbi:hypothetical protein JCM8547_003896 [Rhodosporidiobolus lusitaniae]